MALRGSVRPDGSWRPTCIGCHQPFEPGAIAIAPEISAHPGVLYHPACLPAHYLEAAGPLIAALRAVDAEKAER